MSLQNNIFLLLLLLLVDSIKNSYLLKGINTVKSGWFAFIKSKKSIFVFLKISVISWVFVFFNFLRKLLFILDGNKKCCKFHQIITCITHLLSESLLRCYLVHGQSILLWRYLYSLIFAFKRIINNKLTTLWNDANNKDIKTYFTSLFLLLKTSNVVF